MALETVSHLNDLVATNPVSSDPKSAGDDHIRNIKKALLADFPNITGAVTPTQVELNYVDGVTSAIQTQMDLKAPKANPALTGTATLVNQETSGTASFTGTVTINGSLDMNAGTASTITGLAEPSGTTDAATKNYVDTKVSALINSAPAALDTLVELATALGNDAAFATTVTNSIAAKLPLAGGTMSGVLNMGSQKITALATPTAGSDAVNLTYVDTLYGSTASAASSAYTATTQASNASSSATTASNYAVKVDAYVTGTDNSAKAWALGGTGTGQPAAGDAKSWATKATTAVAGTDYSAKEYASGDATASGGSAKAWATDASSPDGTSEKSAKTLAAEAAVSAAAAAVLQANSLKSNATTGVMQITGPATGTTRVMTVPDANATLLTTLSIASSISDGDTTHAPDGNSVFDALALKASTAYVDNAVLGQNYKEAAKYATTTALPTIVYANGSSGVGATITGFAVGALSVDGASPSVADRILVKDQASTLQQGIYTVTATGSGAAVFVLTRATDFDVAADIKTGDSLFVSSGTTNISSTWTYNAADAPAIGTDALTFVQTAGANRSIVGITGTIAQFNTAVSDADLAILGANTFTGAQTLPAAGAILTGTSSGSTTLTAGAAASGTAVLPAAGGTLSTLAGTETLTNKRVTPRVSTATSYTTDTGTSLNCDTLDEFIVTAQAGALKFNNPTGTAVEGQVLLIAVTGTAARVLTYDTQFEASTVALPATTVTTARLNLAFIWAAATSKWILLGAA